MHEDKKVEIKVPRNIELERRTIWREIGDRLSYMDEEHREAISKSVAGYFMMLTKIEQEDI